MSFVFLRLGFTAALLLLIVPPAIQGAMNVWVIGDYARIDPMTGRAFEHDPMLFPDGLAGNYRDSNLVWDGRQRRISLKAARNEIVAFQIIVERTGEEHLTNVNVKLGALSGPDGKQIPERNIDLLKAWYVHVENRSKSSYSLGLGWYPDGLLPCLRWTGKLYPHMYVLPFDIPDLLNNIGPNQRNHSLWVDTYVPRERQDAPPGEYTSTITVSSDAGAVELKLELSIWDFALPEESHLKPNIHTNTEIHNFNEPLEMKYYQLIRRHRLAMGALGYAPEMEVSGTEPRLDWAEYDARLSKYLDGSAFTERHGYHGPGHGVPIEFLVLPFDAYPVNLYKQSRRPGAARGKEFKFYRPWPVAVPREGPTPDYREVWKKAFQGFQQHLDRPEWNRTRYVFFPLSLDEAYDEVSREQMFYYGELLRESGADKIEYRVDGWYPPDTMRRLTEVVDIAILGLGGWEQELIEELRAGGMDPWFYVGAGQTDGDILQGRALSWVAWKYRAGSWTVWELDFNALRAWQDPETYPISGNGFGFLVYRGEAVGLEEPVASIRLKQMRRGSQDYEYFVLLSQRDGGRTRADAVVDSVIHDFVPKLASRVNFGAAGMWKHDGEDWERARMKAGDIIEKLGNR